jgi:membrane protein required for colicin V production
MLAEELAEGARVNQFDLFLLVLACVLVVVGMLKGLVRILIGLAALVAAFAVAARYHQPLAHRMSGLDIGFEPLSLISYLLIFLAVMVLGGIAARLSRRILKAAMLGWADRLGGAALGLLAALLVAALLVLPLVAYSPGSERLLARSRLAPYVTVVADLANTLAPADLSRRYREGVEGLRRFWREHVNDGLEAV